MGTSMLLATLLAAAAGNPSAGPRTGQVVLVTKMGVRGVVRRGPGLEGRRLDDVRVYARRRSKTVEAPVAADGRFFLPFDENDARVDARSPSGDVAGFVTSVDPLPGGADQVTITLHPTVAIEGDVRLRSDVLAPHVVVEAFPRDDDGVPLRAISDDRGRFRLLVAPGPYNLRATADGHAWSEVDASDGRPQTVTVILDRLPLVLGAVARKADGTCVGSKVEVKVLAGEAADPPFLRVFPVSRSCSFAATELPAENNAADLRLKGARRATARVSHWDDDHPLDVPAPVCLAPPCAGDWKRASLWVAVQDPNGVLVPASVDATAEGDTEAATCDAAEGLCFVHGLRPDTNVTVRARAGARSGSAVIVAKRWITDVVVPLK